MHWNDVVALAVATEPCYYTRIFHTLRWPHWTDSDTQEKNISAHTVAVLKVCKQIGWERARELHRELCLYADLLDHNRTVHTLLRLSKADLRERLEGKLGGAVHIKAMAEMIRRGTEEAWA